MAVCCETETEHSHTLCGQYSDFLLVLNLLGKCPNRKDVRVETASEAALDFCSG